MRTVFAIASGASSKRLAISSGGFSEKWSFGLMKGSARSIVVFRFAAASACCSR